MAEEQNGTLYINAPPPKEGFFTHVETIDGDYNIDSAACAGPGTVTRTGTVTGTLGIG